MALVAGTTAAQRMGLVFHPRFTAGPRKGELRPPQAPRPAEPAAPPQPSQARDLAILAQFASMMSRERYEAARREVLARWRARSLSQEPTT